MGAEYRPFGTETSGQDEGSRIVGETGDIILTEGDWELQNHEQDNGPTIYHVPCDRYVIDLNRGYPVCRKCGEDIPSSMVHGFSMLNWDQIDNSEYFVAAAYEHHDHEYYYLQRVRTGVFDMGVDSECGVSTVKNSDWFSMDDTITHFCGGMTDSEKVNKPKGTQVEATKWFNPTEKKEESEVVSCKACGAEHQPEDEVVIVGGK